MHELSIVQALVEEVEKIRVRENAAGVVSVTVQIGALSGVELESLNFSFPMAIEGTGMANAALVITKTPAEVTCDECGEKSEPYLEHMRCGACGSEQVRLSGGREVMIKSVELRI
ncbi:MAG: hydrogenase maturation nickel metallochaperone HypA [bacterium]